ncbi:carbamoyltransferase C-terminal domain-containing protein [Pseudodesulfovibrio sp.]|uniref:carbamoyltransferase C-terminal domain-containing protein n=1 Tax=unclassified Pseudodesulfovibrio TaxID=2661612 RepID=UPI003AFFF725
MNILSVFWGFPSCAALLQDGRLTRAVSEERFSRTKNDERLPLESIRYCLEGVKNGAAGLDYVAIAGASQDYWYTLKRKSSWSIEDYITEQREYWHPKLIEGKDVHPSAYLSERFDYAQYPEAFWEASKAEPSMVENFASVHMPRIIAEAVGVQEEKIRIMDHHRSHACYGYYTGPLRAEKDGPVLSLTIDGWGDGCNATIYRFDGNSKGERLFASQDAFIGRIYRYITLVLGMKPNEHEYKVMGLAPYCKAPIARKAYEVFASTLYVDGLDFKWKIKPTDSYYWFKERLEGCRFDGIAAGLQRWTEELVTTWVDNAVKTFGIDQVCLSGGVAMNVKANGLVGALDSVKRLHVPGSAGDDSLALGAAYALTEDLGEESGTWDTRKVHPQPHLYLGPVRPRDEEDALVKGLASEHYEIIENYSPDHVADLLEAGRAIARCAGNMEFGQRALGNRSILADPIHLDIVPKINQAIKNRDFWMPFAPIVMDTFADRYLVNEKKLDAPFMTLAFPTTSEGWAALPAGCHQADHTARAQILTRDVNPELYAILESFARKTGRGALLNTSFNLHGYPIVNSVKDAMHVFENSGLDALVLEKFIIYKR